jgi:hypothetical protein
MPAGRQKKLSKNMDRLCKSSWIGSHESFQVKEYDAGASQLPKVSVEATHVFFLTHDILLENF